MIVRLTSDEALAMWPTLWGYLESVVHENVFHEAEEKQVKKRVRRGEQISFVSIEGGEITGAAVVKPVRYRGGWVAEIIYGKAERSEIWQEALTDIEEWALKHKFAAVEVNGRIGWERLLKEKDYCKVCVVMRKALRDA